MCIEHRSLLCPSSICSYQDLQSNYCPRGPQVDCKQGKWKVLFLVSGLLVAHSATQYISLSVCLFVHLFVRHTFSNSSNYTLCAGIFSSIELSDLLAQIPWLICLFFKHFMKFQSIFQCYLAHYLAKSQSLWVKSLSTPNDLPVTGLVTSCDVGGRWG